jgi:predicted nucleic acid-binding protein
MDRLFLDANVLFSAAYHVDAGLRRLWRIKGVVLCSSRYAFEEALINLEEDQQRDRLAELAKAVRWFHATRTTLPPGIALPSKDGPILLAAIEADATHLLTGDIRHFGAYLGKNFEGVEIMLPGEYLRRRFR